ncbi:hypothetical protein [Ruficoccus sp. ZRK36]|uniref:hypothetical protein n=1 Tax=Ruficoccus sp. ZRK36 TaxID=2866311 RepID=UPI001C72A49B|nr:hypothetical protein [Ruficoccus sp. ZRK36]QYY34908.1 hypothetical protein K0V07_11405 [Ruficoccus sp. ZRK36]
MSHNSATHCGVDGSESEGDEDTPVCTPEALDAGEFFAELAEVLEAWGELPAHIRQSILALVKVGRSEGEPPRAEQESAPKGSLATARKEAAGLALGPAKKRNRSTGEGAR